MPKPTIPDVGSLWQRDSSGEVFKVEGFAVMEYTRQDLVMYRSVHFGDADLMAMPVEEFNDGRFIPVVTVRTVQVQ